MKTIMILLLVFLQSCSQAPEPQTDSDSKEKAQPKKLSNDHALKGYQDQLQKAKDMEKEVLKAAERQKKAIEDASK